MLQQVDEALESLARQRVPLPTRDVDIAFGAPDRDWSARLSRPTVNFFLWDVRPNLSERSAGLELRDDGDGHRRRHAPLARLDLRYVVTAWTSEVRDEHALLDALLQLVLLTPEIPAELLATPYDAVRPLPTLRLAAGDGKDVGDFWSSLGGRLKPGIDLFVTATMPATVESAVHGPVTRLDLQFGPRSRVDGSVPSTSGTWSTVVLGPHPDEGNGWRRVTPDDHG